MSGSESGPDFDRARAEMVRSDIARRGVKDARVLEALGRVPREKFVNPVDREEAYADHPLGIGCGQTISQPYIVALMTGMLGLRGAERVLEVGTGSGYQTAILAGLAGRVYTVERHVELGMRAQRLLEDLGYENVEFMIGDGTLGWPRQAPFDAILVTAGAPAVPPSLREQLADGGRLVAPIGPGGHQTLVKVTRRGGAFEEERGIDCIFVPLIGEQGHRG